MLHRIFVPFALALIRTSAFAAAAATADVPPRAHSGQSLEVPREHLDLGEIHHVAAGEDGQIVVTADAPLQRFVAVSRRVVGYVVVPFDRAETDAPFSKGFLRVPASSFDVGSADLNEFFRGPQFLAVESHPEISVELVSVSDVKPVPEPRKPAAFEMTAQCRLTIKGKAIDKSISLRTAIMPFTFETMNRWPGDLITIRASFELTLAEAGLARPDRSWALRIPDAIRIDVFLLCNNVPPEKSLEAISTPANAHRLRYLTFARDLNQPLEGLAVAREFVEQRRDDAVALLRLATDILRETPAANRHLGVALDAARRASALSKDGDVNTLHTAAGICAERGDFAAAVDWEKKALNVALETEKRSTAARPTSAPASPSSGRAATSSPATAAQAPSTLVTELRKTVAKYESMAEAATPDAAAGPAN